MQGQGWSRLLYKATGELMLCEYIYHHSHVIKSAELPLTLENCGLAQDLREVDHCFPKRTTATRRCYVALHTSSFFFLHFFFFKY